MIVFSQTSLPRPQTHTDTWPGGQLSWLQLLPLPWGQQADRLLISRTIIRAEAVYHAVCSQQEASVSNGPWYSAPLHLSLSPPYLKHHRSPHHPSLLPGATLSGGGWLLLCCQHWSMFLIDVARLMSLSSVLLETTVTLVTAVWKQWWKYHHTLTPDIFMLSILKQVIMFLFIS